MTASFDDLWDYNNPSDTEGKFRALRSDLPPEAQAELDTQIARTLGLQRKFDEGHALLDATVPTSPTIEVRWLLERGRLFNSSGSPDKARPLFEKATELAVSEGLDGLAVDGAHMVAIVTSGDEALAWNERALAMAHASDDPKAQRWKGSLLNNLGWTYHDAGNLDRALEMFEGCLAFHQERDNTGPIGIAEWSIARTYRSMGRLDEALAIQRRLYEGDQSGYVPEELGELLLLKGQPEDARPYFAEAHATLSKNPWLVADEPERLNRLLELAGQD